MNALSYSLFGYKGDLSGAVPFAAYFRGLSFNMKMAELLYPGWIVHVTLDEPTYTHFKPYFDYHVEHGKLNIDVVEHNDLCRQMLQRMRPIFDGGYDRVLCRDIDSILTYRERQAVEYWIGTGRAVHAITDNVVHNVALMGGMIGVACREFKMLVGANSFDKFVKLGSGIDYKIKGADQTFLNKFILPKVAGSMVEHYVLGLPQSFRGECYNFIQDIPVEGVDAEMGKESNYLTEHIGSCGYYADVALQFFEKWLPEKSKNYYKWIEDEYKEVHYWRYVV